MKKSADLVKKEILDKGCYPLTSTPNKYIYLSEELFNELAFNWHGKINVDRIVIDTYLEDKECLI